MQGAQRLDKRQADQGHSARCFRVDLGGFSQWPDSRRQAVLGENLSQHFRRCTIQWMVAMQNGDRLWGTPFFAQILSGKDLLFDLAVSTDRFQRSFRFSSEVAATSLQRFYIVQRIDQSFR